jgi:Sulfotransferase family
MKPKENALLIHIGFHKTGTTWLQRSLLRVEFGYNPVMDHADVFDYIVKPHGLLFNCDIAKRLLTDRCRNFDDGHVNVISSELLCGNPLFGGRESEIVAERLKAIAPDARILITIREQMSMLASVYMQYISRGGSLSPKQFFNETHELGYFTFSSVQFEYHRLIEKYRTLFGSSQVLVLTQEQLNADIVGFMSQLAAFSGNDFFCTAKQPNTTRVGVSFPESFVRPFRLVNFLRSGPTGRDSLIGPSSLGQKLYHGIGRVSHSSLFAGIAKTHKPVSTVVREHFRGRYAESNIILRSQLPDQSVWLKNYQ